MTRDWILYSDIGNTDVILDSILFVVTSSGGRWLVAAILAFSCWGARPAVRAMFNGGRRGGRFRWWACPD